MGAIKYTIYNQETLEKATIAKALGHPARMAMLKILKRELYCTNIELAAYLQLHPTTVSQHLNCLKNANLIHGVYFGKVHTYCLSEEYYKKVELLSE
jgi:ArsR family transcriptional regulator